MVSEPVTPRLLELPVELLDPTEMAQADHIAAETIPSFTLMEAAGAAVATEARRIVASRPGHIVILCGPGNNGGDGFVAARLLAEAGFAVTVVSLAPTDQLRGDAAGAAAKWEGETVAADGAAIETADLVIDALFGAGLARDIDGAARVLIERVNARHGPVLAVDIPSGVDGADGAIRGVAVEATETVTFFRLKPGHVLLPGRQRCGRISLADIGIESRVLDRIAPTTRLNSPRSWGGAYPVPSLAGHKYSRGHAVIVSGPVAQTGAARLCARGALRVGAGLVTVATPAEALPVHAAALTAVMTRVAENAAGLTDLLADPRKNAVALGPGLGVGAETRDLVAAALRPAGDTPRGVVLDADALTSFADAPDSLFAMIRESGHAVVLTPHDGEYARLFGAIADAGTAKPERARAAARASGAVLVLKGPDTVVAHPDGRAMIAMSEAPWLATAGSGDVLAGMICGLLAQHMPAFEAAAAAVWLHAEAARLFGPGLISEDLPEILPRVLSNLLAQGLIEET